MGPSFCIPRPTSLDARSRWACYAHTQLLEIGIALAGTRAQRWVPGSWQGSRYLVPTKAEVKGRPGRGQVRLSQPNPKSCLSLPI